MAVRLRQGAVTDIRQALREGTVDLAVVALDRQQQRGLVTRLLAREEMVLVSAPGRVLGGTGPDGRVTLAEAARLPLVDFTPGWAIRLAVDRAFRAAAVERESTFEVNDIVAASNSSAPTSVCASCPSRSPTASPTWTSTGSTGTRRAGRSWWSSHAGRCPRRSRPCCGTWPDGCGVRGDGGTKWPIPRLNPSAPANQQPPTAQGCFSTSFTEVGPNCLALAYSGIVMGLSNRKNDWFVPTVNSMYAPVVASKP